MSDEVKPWWKEWVDQPLHMLMTAGLMAMAYFQIPLLGAAFFAFFWMWLREVEQHAWNWRLVGRTDLSFCLLSIVLFILVTEYRIYF